MKRIVFQVMNSLKILLSYMVCLGISLLYTLFVDGTSGVLLMSFIILVPLMSLILVLINKNAVNVSISSSDSTYRKGSPIGVTFKFTKKSILPVPFINVVVGYSAHLCNGDTYSIDEFPQLRTSMAFEKSLSCDFNFKAKVSGDCSIYVSEAYMYDYLGFFRFKLKNIDTNTKIYIIPDVIEISSSQTLFNNICNSVIMNDEEEESHQNDVLSIGSTLGYLHREYVAGDSPKRIDWKLSCKKDTLMVRLDEPSPQSKPCILLDMSIDNSNSNMLDAILNFERLVESSLALASMCVRNSIECEFMLCNCGNSKSYMLTSVDDVYNLAVAICHNCEDGEHRLPNGISKLKTSDSMYILFTDSFKGNLKSEVTSLKNRGIVVETILSPRYKGMYSQPNVWIVNDDLSIAQSD